MTGTVRQAVRRMELVSAPGVAVAAAEFLCRPRFRRAGGFFSRPEAEGKAQQDVLVHAGRLAAAVSLIAGPERGRVLANGYLAGSGCVLQYRYPHGRDGADQMHVFVQAAAALCGMTRDSTVQRSALWFVAGQTALAYFVSGLAKSVSRQWRDGSALVGVARTASSGHRRLHAVLSARPAAVKVLSRAVIVLELAFPLVLVMPRPFASALLGAAKVFHLGTALAMGLNRFPFAFFAAHEAVRYCARRL
ncbi:HTTM domain-containing protein [Amycolatopsis sp. lyj-108]|uniref:HTTM domain-containing protein n=1 Tax=Amycolatopsis sp. lyj-108 TaxID=2789286 RepID=UPI003979F56D